MKCFLRFSLFSFLCGMFVLQTACSTFSDNTDNTERNSSASAPVEDKSLINRNPYAPAAAQMPAQSTQVTPTPKKPELGSHKPSLRLEEVPEDNPPTALPAEPHVKPSYSLWIWPTESPVIRQFDATSADGKGIDFGGKVGDSVRAVRSGKVVFSGAGLKGYGQLIIIKHDSNVLTAYAHNHNLLVKEGDLVDAGQVISEMGLNERTGTPMLHFEVRLNGKPVDPQSYLPLRH